MCPGARGSLRNVPRGPRLDALGALQYVIVRGLDRQTSFRTEEDRREFLYIASDDLLVLRDERWRDETHALPDHLILHEGRGRGGPPSAGSGDRGRVSAQTRGPRRGRTDPDRPGLRCRD